MIVMRELLRDQGDMGHSLSLCVIGPGHEDFQWPVAAFVKNDMLVIKNKTNYDKI